MSKQSISVGPLLLSAGAGAVIAITLGFWQGGWVLGSTAEQMATDASEKTAVALLTPQCVASATADTDKLAEFNDLKGWKQSSFVDKAGWLNYPKNASNSLKQALKSECTNRLTKLEVANK